VPALNRYSWIVAPDNNDDDKITNLNKAQQAFNDAYKSIMHGDINTRDAKTDEWEEYRQHFKANVLKALRDIANSLH
jgi:hypothetical protein